MTAGLKRETLIPGVGREEAVSFPVQGDCVHGVLSSPADGGKSVGIVFVHGWSGNRAGPHGLLTGLARHFAALGYPSLRFDFRGRGESEGEGLEASLPSMAEDLVGATASFREATGLDRVVYFGLCSGGNVTIGTLPSLPAAGLILLSVYPFSDGDAFGRDVHRTFHYLKVYWHKATRGDTWRRLFRGDVSVKGVCNVLFGHFLNRGRNRKKEGEQEQEEKPASSGRGAGKTAKAAATESRTQGGEAPKKHLAKLRADLPVLMVYGTSDPDAPAARTYFGDYVSEHGLPVDMVEIPGANHNFSSADWKRQVSELADSFLTRLA
ncbi:MAG: alpha/beta fold hydrolase [Victivallales bacterium]|nr:alpha/beta fold hydrolase [Victivallales bacterium]